MPGRLLEISVIPLADMPAKNGNECKPRVLSRLAQQADMRARGVMAALSVRSLTSNVGADRAVGACDSAVRHQSCRCVGICIGGKLYPTAVGRTATESVGSHTNTKDPNSESLNSESL